MQNRGGHTINQIKEEDYHLAIPLRNLMMEEESASCLN